MNLSGLYRLIKPIASASFGKEAFHGCLIGRFKQYSTIPEEEEEEPDSFTILHPNMWPGTEGSWKNSKASYKILASGMILLRKYINIKGQVDIVNTVVRQAKGPGAFYVPRNQYGDKLQFGMTTFGRNWDPITRYEKRCRSDDGSEPPQIPPNFIYLAETAIKDAQAYLNELPSMRPDICVTNFYPSGNGQFGIHRDCDERYDSLEKGLPIVSIFVGETVEFCYGHTGQVSKMSKVRIKSGDVLIFGGKSRLIYHGVKNILIDTSPRDLVQAVTMAMGCLNPTLKQV